jgi:hypothetical protein
MSSPQYYDDGRSGWSGVGSKDTAASFETLNDYYGFRPPVGSMLNTMPIRGADMQFVNMSRTSNQRVSPVRFGYDTLTGVPRQQGSRGGNGGFFTLQAGYAPK